MSLKPLKLTNKKSLKERLFSFHSNETTKITKKRLNLSPSSSRKKSWKSLIIKTNSNSNSTQRKHQSFVGFIHGTIEKLTHSPPARTLSDVNSFNLGSISPKSQWKPSLDAILNDSQLLSALITFMTRSYNQESIFFLQAIQELKAQFNCVQPNEVEIDDQIYSIFHLYIAPTAEFQVNVSSDCFVNTAKMCQPVSLSTFSLDQKQSIFNDAVKEVQRLMVASVLDLFYDSLEFQSMAHTLSHHNDDNVAVVPPIILSMSRSTLSVDVNVHVENEEIDEADVFVKDEMVFMDIDDEYLSSPSSLLL